MTNGVFNEPAPETPTDDNQIDPVIQKRLMDKDAFIAQLELEARERQEALERKEAELETARLLIEARDKAANPPPSREATPAAQEPAKSDVNPDDLVERVLEAQERRTAQAKAAANVQTVSDHLVTVYGTLEAAQKAVADRATELGVSTNFLMEAAAKSPAAFYELAKIDAKPQTVTAPRSDVNTAALKTHAPGVKLGTPEYYEQLRKEIGDAAFYTPKVQQQRFKDMQAYYASKN